MDLAVGSLGRSAMRKKRQWLIVERQRFGPKMEMEGLISKQRNAGSRVIPSRRGILFTACNSSLPYSRSGTFFGCFSSAALIHSVEAEKDDHEVHLLHKSFEMQNENPCVRVAAQSGAESRTPRILPSIMPDEERWGQVPHNVLPLTALFISSSTSNINQASDETTTTLGYGSKCDSLCVSWQTTIKDLARLVPPLKLQLYRTNPSAYI